MIMAGILFGSCTGGAQPRRLAVGGTHVFEGPAPCKLARVDDERMFRNLEWVGALALEAVGEGNAEVECGKEEIRLKVVAPARLEIELMNGGKSSGLVVDERFQVRAKLYDRSGNELEVGKSTILEWKASDILEAANDRSAGEFGFSDTAFGMHSFRATRPGKGAIKARFGDLQAELPIEAGS